MLFLSSPRVLNVLVIYLLPPANEVWGKVIFTPVCHSVHRGACMVGSGGVCMVAPRGACMVALGGMCGCSQGGMHGCSQGGMHGCSWGGICGCSQGCVCLLPGRACVVALERHVWLLRGACMVAWGVVHGFIWGACVVLFGGHAWFYSGGHVWFYSGGHAWSFQFFRIQWDTVNEWAVRILLECILVLQNLFTHRLPLLKTCPNLLSPEKIPINSWSSCMMIMVWL